MISEAELVVTNTVFGYTIVDLLSYVAFWVLYPLSMVFLCRTLNLTQNSPPYIIVYNWSSVLVAALVAPPYVLYRFRSGLSRNHRLSDPARLYHCPSISLADCRDRLPDYAGAGSGYCRL